MVLWAVLALPLVLAQSFHKTYLGFPEAWDGDKYKELYCPSKNIPKWLDGFFLCQLSASYGNQSAPAGQKLNHMIDAIGAVGNFHIKNGEVVFSANYYPARPYKIWEFYDRNMSKSSVPWAGWSDYNLTAMSRWEQVPANPDAARFHPNLDFWKIGNKIVGGTEAPYWVGYEFDVKTLSNFNLFKFTEDNDVFAVPRPSMIPISMAIHERNDPDGTIWGSFSAMNFEDQRFFQGIFTIDRNGVRKVVGLHDYGPWDTNACGANDEYIGDKTLLPGYIHSITSTENYIILPITSLLINPCKFKEPPMTNIRSAIQQGGLWGMDFHDMVPMRFIIFNKKTKEFVSHKPLEVFPSMFVTHQLNAFEAPDGSLVADMVVYDSHDPYIKYFYTDFLTTQLYPSTARILRFTLDHKQHRVMYNYLVPQETIAADFPQFNHKYEQKSYQWAYLVEHPFASDNRIIKINVDEPNGSRNKEFKTDPQLILHEPYFVAKPDSRKEDDGILMIRALDVVENKGVLLIADAETMLEIGRAFVPINIPFGFHNRFYSKKDLGMAETAVESSSQPNQFRPVEKKIGFSTLQLRKLTTTGTPVTTTTSTTTQLPATTTTLPTTSTTTTKRPTTTTEATTTTSERPETVTTQKWVPTTTVTLKPTTASTPGPSPTPKVPRWWPLPASTEMPWWQKVHQAQQGTLPPVFPAAENLKNVNKQPTMIKTIPTSQSGNEVLNKNSTKNITAIEDIYSQTLDTLCSWLPKVFSTISNDMCLQQGKKAAKWVAPLANSYAERFRVGRANRKLPPVDTPVMKPVLRTAPIQQQVKPAPQQSQQLYKNY